LKWKFTMGLVSKVHRFKMAWYMHWEVGRGGEVIQALVEDRKELVACIFKLHWKAEGATVMAAGAEQRALVIGI
jgi:hypothetical protein